MLRLIDIFLAVANTGSMSAAARGLGIAQPAISQSVARLEHSMKAQLFVRTVNGVDLTPAGRIFLRHAKSIRQQMDRALSDTRHANSAPSGEVKMVLAASIATILGPRVAIEVERNFPDIRVTVIKAMTDRSADLLREGKVDIGLIPYGQNLENVDAEVAYTESLFLTGRSDMPLAGDAPITFDEACAAPLISFPHNHYTRRTLEQMAFDRGLSLNVRVVQNSSSMLHAFLMAGHVYALSPWSSVLDGVRDGSQFARRVIEPEITRQITVTTLAEKADWPALTVVRNQLWREIEKLRAMNRFAPRAEGQ